MKKNQEAQRSGLFLWLRRLADVFYLLFALMLFAALALSFYFLGKSFFETRQVNNVATVEDNSKANSPALQWGIWQHVPGASCLLLPVEARQEYGESYYSKSATSVRNLLFFKPGESQHWLFPKHQQLLLNRELLMEKAAPSALAEEKLEKTQAVFYQLVRDDTNRDGKWTVNDAQVIAFSKPCGEDYREVLTVEKFFGFRTVEKNFLLFYQQEGIAKIALIDGATFALIREESLPALQ